VSNICEKDQSPVEWMRSSLGHVPGHIRTYWNRPERLARNEHKLADSVNTVPLPKLQRKKLTTLTPESANLALSQKFSK